MRKSITGEFKIYEVDYEGTDAYVGEENLIWWLDELLRDRQVSKRSYGSTESSFGRIRITVTALD